MCEFTREKLGEGQKGIEKKEGGKNEGDGMGMRMGKGRKNGVWKGKKEQH